MARAERIDLLRRYARAGDEAERSQILRRLEASLTPAERSQASARLLDWLAPLPPPAVEAEYERYTLLLSQALAGTLIPGSPAHADFMSLVASWGEEYEELKAAMEAGHEQGSRPHTPSEVFPDFDRSFLRLDAGIVWSAELAATMEIARKPASTLLLFSFTARVRPAGQGQLREAAGGYVVSRRDLVLLNIGPAPELGLPVRYQVVVQAERLDEISCRLIVNVWGPGPRVRNGEIAVSVESGSMPGLTSTPDERGDAVFDDVPIEALDGLTLSIELPTSPPDAARPG